MNPEATKSQHKRERSDTLRAFVDVGSIGIEMGLAVAVGYWLGSWLDGRFGTAPVLMYVFLVAGIGAGFKGLLRVARKSMAAEARRDARAKDDNP